ncbi:hypothetical protein RIF29_20901 [Crotalaria pallida]|uniref:Uncharacterized protein n=1 Tax=Crotalaria pallida TaxID=3830 RepID=A0AAN9I5H0_CROPI
MGANAVGRDQGNKENKKRGNRAERGNERRDSQREKFLGFLYFSGPITQDPTVQSQIRLRSNTLLTLTLEQVADVNVTLSLLLGFAVF